MSEIDLDRRFRIVGEDEQTEDVDQLADLFGRERGETWGSLLRSKRVVILAEAGAGKTTELRAQAHRINSDGGEAFFVPIERLNDFSLADAIDAADADRFSSWVQGESRPATLFLDAVDELKLVRGSFSTALHRIRKELASVIDRVQLVVSSRPGDWLGKADLEEVRATLPTTRQTRSSTARPTRSPAENHADRFAAAIRLLDVHSDGGSSGDDESKPPDIVVAALLPLDRDRAIRLLDHLGVSDPDEAATQLDEANAWELTRTPLGAIHVAAYWSHHGSIGTRAQQLEFSTQQCVLEREDRQQMDDSPLPASDLLQGGERLALGMLLSKQRSLTRTKQAKAAPTEPSAECLLPDWSPRHVERLVNTALFVPSAIDRVKFRHLAVQEYLAAKMLDRLTRAGLRSVVHQLLFADSHTEKVVIPSMKPASAWLALWDAETRQELLRRDSEVLVLHGDAQSLSVDARAQLVRRYVDAYGRGGYRGMTLPPTEIRRLATPEHAPLLKEIYSRDDLNEDAKRFVLKQMWLGKMRSCVDQLLKAAMDPSESDYVRMLGVRGLVDLDALEELACVAGDILASDTNRWSHTLVRQASESLYPRVISTDDLVNLIQRTPEPRRSTTGFGWSLRQIAHALDPRSEQAVEFRSRLVRLLVDAPITPRSRYGTPHSKFEYVSEAVIISCKRSVAAGYFDRDVALSAAIAHRIGGREYLVRDETEHLQKELNNGAERRKVLWMCEFEAFRAIFGELGDPREAQLVGEGGLAKWEAEDTAWALDLAADASQPAGVRRGLVWLVYQNATGTSSDSELQGRMLRATVDLEGMEAAVSQWFAPPSRESRARALRMNRRRAKAEKKRKGREALRLRGWEEWRERLVANPESHFGGKRCESALIEIAEILIASVEGCERFAALEQLESLQDLFSKAVHDAFVQSVQAYWLTKLPPVRSRRRPRDRNSLYYSQTVALTGINEWLKLHSTTSAWATLSSSQATRAAEWSTLQFNSFPDWLGALAAAWPNEVRQVYRQEIEAEASDLSVEQHPIMLGMLHKAPIELRQLIAPLIFQLAERARAPSSDDAARGRFCSNMETVLSWLADNDSLLAIGALESMAARRLSRTSKRVDSAAWFRTLATLSLDRSLDWFERAIGRLNDSGAKRDFAERMMSVFGDRDRVLLSADTSVTQLLRLVKITRAHIREEDDVLHPGVYTPGTRDFAEDARRNVFGLLSERPGREAYHALIGLADSGYYKNFEDWLRRRARLKAEFESERSPFTAGEYEQWIKLQCGPLRTADELLDRVVSVLRDIQYDVSNAALSHRLAWRSLGAEGDLQPSLGSELEKKSAGQFSIHREPEVVDQKKPDYIVQSSASMDRVAIELKLIDKWSGNELVERLENQLIGQYMRHRECRVGVFLLVAQQKQGLTFTIAGRQMRMKLARAVDHLQGIANQRVAACPTAERVVVLLLHFP